MMKIKNLKLASLIMAVVMIMTTIPSAAFAEDLFSSEWAPEVEEEVDLFGEAFDEAPVSDAGDAIVFDADVPAADDVDLFADVPAPAEDEADLFDFLGDGEDPTGTPAETPTTTPMAGNPVDKDTIDFYVDEAGNNKVRYQVVGGKTDEAGNPLYIIEDAQVDPAFKREPDCETPGGYVTTAVIDGVRYWSTDIEAPSDKMEYFDDPAVPALGHDWKLVKREDQEPTCLQEGMTTLSYECARNAEHKKTVENPIAKLNHVFESTTKVDYEVLDNITFVNGSPTLETPGKPGFWQEKVTVSAETCKLGCGTVKEGSEEKVSYNINTKQKPYDREVLDKLAQFSIDAEPGTKEDYNTVFYILPDLGTIAKVVEVDGDTLQNKWVGKTFSSRLVRNALPDGVTMEQVKFANCQDAGQYYVGHFSEAGELLVKLVPDGVDEKGTFLYKEVEAVDRVYIDNPGHTTVTSYWTTDGVQILPTNAYKLGFVLNDKGEVVSTTFCLPMKYVEKVTCTNTWHKDDEKANTATELTAPAKEPDPADPLAIHSYFEAELKAMLPDPEEDGTYVLTYKEYEALAASIKAKKDKEAEEAKEAEAKGEVPVKNWATVEVGPYDYEGSCEEPTFVDISFECLLDATHEKKHLTIKVGPHNHVPGEPYEKYELRIEPTCTLPGEYVMVVDCTVCKKEIARETLYIDALGHDFSDVDVAADLWEGSVVVDRGSSAGDPQILLDQYVAGNKLPVDYDVHKNTLYDTDVRLGVLPVAHLKCARCGELGKDLEEAQVTTTASDIVSQGDACVPGSIKLTATAVAPWSQNPETKIPAQQTLDNVAKGVKATATDAKAFVYYTSRDTYHSGIKGHNLTFVPAVAADCKTSTDGTVGYYYCSNCETKFADVAGEQMITDIVVKASHTFEDVEGKAATCEEDGYTAYQKCKVCGEEIGKEIISATGHDLEDVEGKEATCEEDGYTAYQVCKTCGAEIGKDVIDATGHDLEDVEGKAATCEEDGYTAYQVCKTCGAEIGKDVIEATGHDYENKEGKEATCEEDGYTPYQECKNCGDIVGKETIEATGHNVVTIAAKEPNCLENGNIEHKQCTDCGKLFTMENEPIEDDASVVIPTSEQVANAFHMATFQKAMAENDPTIIFPAKEATCTEDGNIAYAKCPVCGRMATFGEDGLPVEVTEEDTIIKAHHVAGDPVEEDGKLVTRCTVCGEVLVEQVLPIDEPAEPVIPGVTNIKKSLAHRVEGTVTLKYAAVENADHYEFGWKPAGGSYTNKRTNYTTATASELEEDVMYRLRVRAVSATGDKSAYDYSKRWMHTVKVSTTKGKGKIKVTIKDTSDKTTKYKVSWSLNEDMSDAQSVETTDTTYMITGLDRNTTYYVRVCPYGKDEKGTLYRGIWSKIKEKATK